MSWATTVGSDNGRDYFWGLKKFLLVWMQQIQMPLLKQGYCFSFKLLTVGVVCFQRESSAFLAEGILELSQGNCATAMLPTQTAPTWVAGLVGSPWVVSKVICNLPLTNFIPITSWLLNWLSRGGGGEGCSYFTDKELKPRVLQTPGLSSSEPSPHRLCPSPQLLLTVCILPFFLSCIINLSK